MPKGAGVSLLLALLVGFVLGLRHATDADHVAAIGAMIREANDLRAAVRTGALWGLGHAVTVLGVGAAIALAGLRVSPGAARLAEFAVAAMLVGLGLVNLRAARAPVAPRRPAPRWGGLRPVAVGVVHGLAGSAGTALLALTTLRDPAAALGYLALFSLGTVLGMMALTAALAGSLAATARRSTRARDLVLVAASVGSVVAGVAVAAAAIGGG
jgi:nickel/cobalt exporter